MYKYTRAAVILACLLIATGMPIVAQKPSHVPTPSEFLGFEVGADRKLADYRQVASYFKALRTASDRVEIEVLGKTTLGEEMFMAVISTPENLRNKARYQEIARKLADPRGLSKEQIDALAGEGKGIFLLTCKRLGLAPEQCLFVDDLRCNVDAATELGMTTIQCRDPVAIADEVVGLLLGRAASAEPESAGAGR